MTRRLPLLACGDVRTQKDDDLTRVCLAYDQLRVVAHTSTMTGNDAIGSSRQIWCVKTQLDRDTSGAANAARVKAMAAAVRELARTRR